MKNIEAFTNPIDFSIKEEQGFISKAILLVISIFLICFFLWISFFQIDIIVKGSGKVISSSKLHNVQTVDGGIIDNIFVKEGDIIDKGDKLLSIDNTRFISSVKETSEELKSLKKKLIRLDALVSIKDINKPPKINATNEIDENLLIEEILLYNTIIKNVKNSINSIKAKSIELKNNIKEVYQTIEKLEANKLNIQRQLKIVRQGVSQNIIPVREKLDLESQYSNVLWDIKINKTSIKKLNKALEQTYLEEKKIMYALHEKSLQEKLQVSERISILNSTLTEKEDKVKKTYINSPIKGVVNNILKIEGNVVSPSETLVELVPRDEQLIIEGKIKPKDIGNLSIDNKVIVKVSAYDFSIYGGINGKIINIGADTISSKDGKEIYYRILVKLDQSFLIDKNGHKKQLISGMITDIDIITGKRTLLQYILKPIIKTLGNSLNEQ